MDQDGTEEGLGSGNIVSDGDLAAPHKGAQFVYAASAIFLLPVSTYALVLRLLSPFYSARNARIASAVLATAIPSVRPSVCPSVRHTPV